ncbi:PaaI family thioesterase [Persicobacter psychrovividus]|uniref:DUF4442 domain-containing protein n=1 Tax=Persicobacter psychrovividus TaxID=387638 RepID=A0ABN6LBM4_9BACT|nr:hypothetical protein PEPS_10820 [Persicobacter psychrovividus]
MLEIANAMLRKFANEQVPMIEFCQPEITAFSPEALTVKIPFANQTKNHLNSMYFGAMAVGADVAGGLMAFSMIEQQQLPINLVFKDFHANFIKRPEADVLFHCEEGKKIQKMVMECMSSGERVTDEIRITATCPEKFDQELVAEFQLTLSLKKR